MKFFQTPPVRWFFSLPEPPKQFLQTFLAGMNKFYNSLLLPAAREISGFRFSRVPQRCQDGCGEDENNTLRKLYPQTPNSFHISCPQRKLVSPQMVTLSLCLEKRLGTSNSQSQEEKPNEDDGSFAEPPGQGEYTCAL